MLKKWDIYEVIYQMKDRPALYVGNTTLSKIYVFLSGYELAMDKLNVMEISDPNFRKFHDWIADKLGFRESTPGWPNMILAHTMGLEPTKINWMTFDKNVSHEQHWKSFQRFFELLDEFRSKS